MGLVIIYTYMNYIQPMMWRSCTPCHGATAGAHNWLVYENVYRDRYKISAKIQGNQMPPSKPLNKEDKEIFEIWIDQGAVEK